jgi:hypothetical protein
MRAPSVQTLLAHFRDLTKKDANLIRRLAHEVDMPDKLADTVERFCPKTQAYVRSMYSDPYNSHMWRVTVALYAMDHILGTHGVEGLGPQGSMKAPPYEYLNAGDTYNTTLIYRRKTDTLSVGTWGDIAEKHPSW